MNALPKFALITEATHHIIQDGQTVYFRNDTTPNQKLVNNEWCNMYADANVAK